MPLNEPVSFAVLLENFDRAVNWVRDLGVELPAGSRFIRHRDTLAELVANHQSPDWIRDRGHAESSHNAVYEAADLQTIHAWLAGAEPPGLAERLRRVVDGPERAADEEQQGGGIHARNAAFELVVAGRIKGAGYVPQLAQRADVVFELDRHRVVTECKRLRRVGKIHQNLTDARRQTLNDLGGVAAGRNSALIAVEASVVVNPGNQLLSSNLPIAEALGALSDRLAHSINVSMEPLWHPRILGVLVRFAGMVATGGIPIYSQQWVLVGNRQTDARRRRLTAELAVNMRRTNTA